MTLRKPYKNEKRKVKGYEDLQKFFSKEIRYSKDDDSEKVKETFISEFEKKDGISRVWLLFANRGNSSWECLQVAHSKNNVQSEIEDVIMFSFCKFDQTSKNISFTNSAFYEEVCPKDTNKKDNRDLLYSKIGSEYENFLICFLNVDKYLGIKSNNTNNQTDMERIIHICKNQYAEAKIAYETLAVYWNKYSSGIDGQTIAYIVKHPSEFKE